MSEASKAIEKEIERDIVESSSGGGRQSMPDKLIKWEILDRAGEVRSGVLAVAVFNPQVGDWSAYWGSYIGKSIQNEANIVAKQGSKMQRIVAGEILGSMVMELNRERMHAGADPYRWRE